MGDEKRYRSQSRERSKDKEVKDGDRERSRSHRKKSKKKSKKKNENDDEFQSHSSLSDSGNSAVEVGSATSSRRRRKRKREEERMISKRSHYEYDDRKNDADGDKRRRSKYDEDHYEGGRKYSRSSRDDREEYRHRDDYRNISSRDEYYYSSRDRDRDRESRRPSSSSKYDDRDRDRDRYHHDGRRERRGDEERDEGRRHGSSSSRSRHHSRDDTEKLEAHSRKTSVDSLTAPPPSSLPPPLSSTATAVSAPVANSSKFSDGPAPPAPPLSKFSDAPVPTTAAALPPKPPVAALTKIKPSTAHLLEEAAEQLPELKQGDLEQAKLEAERLRKKMDDEMKARQEEKKKRLELWAKEQKEKEKKSAGAADDTGGRGTEGVSWNLEDDEDDDEEAAQTAATIAASLPAVIIPILGDAAKASDDPSSATSQTEIQNKPKRTAILGVKKVVKKNAIGFGLKSLASVAPKAATSSRRLVLVDEDDLDEEGGSKKKSSFGHFLLKQQKEEEEAAAALQNGDASKEEGANDKMQEDEVDTLDTFMIDVHVEVKKTSVQDQIALANLAAVKPEDMARVLRDDDVKGVKTGPAVAVEGASKAGEVVAVAADTEMDQDEEDEDVDDPTNLLATSAVEINQADIFAAAAAQAATRKKDIAMVDHSKIQYEPFRKDFYKEPPELSNMTKEALDQKRVDLDGIRVRGHNCPKPIEKWTQFGLPIGVLEVVKKVLKYEAPTPIQAQAVPAIMSGRDVIGIAKTGSGKTIAFLLPMFRHIKDQRPSQGQEGPIGLVMTPTRELAMQIFKDCKNFAKPLGLRVACCYGGSPIKDQIADLKRGADIIICTPGRMIDLLCANGGRVTNLKRVSYLVLDEADRMFDLGFEPQVMKMVANIQPGRQTVLFSATFPRFMEALARKILTKPLEIIVGARSVVASDVSQIVQIHADSEHKFLKLLAILGKTSSEDPSAKFLIFVDRQEAADNMMANLMKRGYPCLSLHGGKDQADRDSVISDFKGDATNILVATSVAARGLDVKDLKVVVNYDCPNHLEDYVHRCGRTGRAGNKGTAYTFLLPDQGSYAVEIVKALTMSNATIPKEVQEMADKQSEQVKLGFARIAGSGFGGRGLGRLEDDRGSIRRIQMFAHGGAEAEEAAAAAKEDERVDEEEEAERGGGGKGGDSAEKGGKAAEEEKPTSGPSAEKLLKAAAERQAKLNAMDPLERARFVAAELIRQQKQQQESKVRVQTDAAFYGEVEINDYPQKARWKVTSKEQISKVSASCNAAITSRGVYVAPGKQAPPGERKLYLFIEADFEHCVMRAKEEIGALLLEATTAALGDRQTVGRYNVT